jgi:hypothetical protein
LLGKKMIAEQRQLDWIMFKKMIAARRKLDRNAAKQLRVGMLVAWKPSLRRRPVLGTIIAIDRHGRVRLAIPQSEFKDLERFGVPATMVIQCAEHSPTNVAEPEPAFRIM